MAPVYLRFLSIALLAVPFFSASAQVAMTPDGALVAQNTAIEQSRILNPPGGQGATGMTADGTALSSSASTGGEDDSFGAQQILKDQERVREFVVSGDASVFYTNNVALTRRNTISDAFFVGNAGLSWYHNINSQLQIQIGGHASIFRYFDTSALDFENLGAGIGLSWVPQTPWGISIFARYDFTELLDKHSNELLQDHEFTIGAQKIWVFNRRHSLTLGVVGSVGISDPFAAQRDGVGGFAVYRLALTDRLDTEIGYRLGGFFYNEGGRNDFNQIVNLGLHYHFTPWMELGGFFSFTSNLSSVDAFKYGVINTGGGIAFTLWF